MQNRGQGDQGRIQDLVLGGTKFGKVIWEYYYYCLRCLWNVWCRKIKIDLQVIMIIWGEETEPLFSLSVFFLHYFLCLFGFLFLFFRGANVPSAPLWIRQWKRYTYSCISLKISMSTTGHTTSDWEGRFPGQLGNVLFFLRQLRGGQGNRDARPAGQYIPGL